MSEQQTRLLANRHQIRVALNHGDAARHAELLADLLQEMDEIAHDHRRHLAPQTEQDSSRVNVDDLAELEEDWNGYGAEKITDAALATARHTQIVPTADGGLQMEWHIAGVDCEIEILANGKIAEPHIEQVDELLRSLADSSTLGPLDKAALPRVLDALETAQDTAKLAQREADQWKRRYEASEKVNMTHALRLRELREALETAQQQHAQRLANYTSKFLDFDAEIARLREAALILALSRWEDADAVLPGPITSNEFEERGLLRTGRDASDEAFTELTVAGEDFVRSALEGEQGEGKTCSCGGSFRRVPYVGGDHDPSNECDRCGKHDGCHACDKSEDADAYPPYPDLPPTAPENGEWFREQISRHAQREDNDRA